MSLKSKRGNEIFICKFKYNLEYNIAKCLDPYNKLKSRKTYMVCWCVRKIM